MESDRSEYYRKYYLKKGKSKKRALYRKRVVEKKIKERELARERKRQERLLNQQYASPCFVCEIIKRKVYSIYIGFERFDLCRSHFSWYSKMSKLIKSLVKNNL